MDIDNKRRTNLSDAEKGSRIFEELKDDLKNLLGGAESLGVGGGEGFKGWLGGRAQRLLFNVQDDD